MRDFSGNVSLDRNERPVEAKGEGDGDDDDVGVTSAHMLCFGQMGVAKRPDQ